MPLWGILEVPLCRWQPSEAQIIPGVQTSDDHCVRSPSRLCHFVAFQPLVFLFRNDRVRAGQFEHSIHPTVEPRLLPFSPRKIDGKSAPIDALKEFRHFTEALVIWWEGLQDRKWRMCFHQWLLFIPRPDHRPARAPLSPPSMRNVRS